ncbi:MAG: NAD(+) diphosphatase [Rhodospirillaceae bacterium]
MTQLPYTHAPLERAELLRGRDDDVRALTMNARARFLAVWKETHAVDEHQRAISFGPEILNHAATHAATLIFLGLACETPWFALAFASDEGPPAVGAASFAGLREIWADTEQALASRLVYARAMAIWHQNHPHCSRCGAKTASTESGHSRTCGACGYRSFPRTDPAVIMLITQGDTCLLGRKAEWRPGQFSTIAGFVEPGESIEHAVRREAAEETGVVVGTVRYMASQPWPFPSSLMLGFRGEALSTQIRRDSDELEDCRWFTKDEVRAAESGPGTLLLPHRSSISRWLIEGWRDET